VEALASLGRELRDREDLRMELDRLEARKGQQRPGGGPSQPGTGARDREDLRLELDRLEARMGQQWTP
jgi:hypothetical protein